MYIILITNHLQATVTIKTEVTRLKRNRAKPGLGQTDRQEQDKRKVKGKCIMIVLVQKFCKVSF